MKTGYWDEIDNDGNRTCAGSAQCGRHEVIDGLTRLESDYRFDDAGPTVPAKQKWKATAMMMKKPNRTLALAIS